MIINSFSLKSIFRNTNTSNWIKSCIYKYKEKGRFKNMFKKITYSTKKLIGSIFDLISSIVIALLP